MSMRKGNEYETTVFGKEPLWTDCATLDEMQMSCRVGRAVNWYNYFCSEEDYKDFVVESLPCGTREGNTGTHNSSAAFCTGTHSKQNL